MCFRPIFGNLFFLDIRNNYKNLLKINLRRFFILLNLCNFSNQLTYNIYNQLNLTKMKTYLPLFQANCNTAYFDFDSECESLLEGINSTREEEGLDSLTDQDVEFDYEKYEIDCAKKCCEFVEKQLTDFDAKIQFEGVHFSKTGSDSINIDIELNIEKLSKFIFENYDLFSEFLHETFTDREGFYSFYSNRAIDWVKETKDFTEFDDMTRLGALLDFVFYTKDSNVDDYYESKIYYEMSTYVTERVGLDYKLI